LLLAVCNYYLPRNDQPSWGRFLRGVAQELAKLEYMYQYDIVGVQPQYLTPPDVKRRYAGPAFVSGSWPKPTQFDKGDFSGFSGSANPVGYRDMIVDLIDAYGMGATVASIEAVIYAYTGKTVVVEELYKEVGNGIYDMSDHNAIRVTVNVGGSNPLTNIQSLQQLQGIVQSLYGAIDLAKPAHVGLEFTTVFTEQEDIALSIMDTLVVEVEMAEAPSLYPMLWVAPLFNVAHPKTTVAAWGRYMSASLSAGDWQALQYLPPAWQAGNSYVRGSLASLASLSPFVQSWLSYRASKKNVGKDPTSNPSYWSPLPSPAPWQGYQPSVAGYSIGIGAWEALVETFTGQYIVDPNGNLELATAGGTTGASVIFGKDKGDITYDGSVTWENQGLSPFTDPSKWILVYRQCKAWSPFGSFVAGDRLIDVNGNLQVALTSGQAAGILPTFSETIGDIVEDGSVAWQCLGSSLTDSPSGTAATGEVANWNAAEPMGLVAPRERLSWVIKNDSWLALDMD